MIVTKRDCTEVNFDKSKIKSAILKAMKYGSSRVDENLSELISNNIEDYFIYLNRREVSIYEIENKVFALLCEYNHQDTAKSYEGYRKVREYQRQANTIDEKVLGLVDGSNKETLDENSNKQADLISTQRDLVAEEVSKDISLRMKLPTRLAQAHQDGIIHIHDLGHYLNPSFNCELINLKDMLENGTVINGKMIDKPKGFRTACTVATQIIAQVASGQFGGQTISLAHLSPFVRISEDKIRRKTIEKWDNLKMTYSNSILEESVLEDLKQEVEDGIQTLQYQINTLQTSNGRLLPL